MIAAAALTGCASAPPQAPPPPAQAPAPAAGANTPSQAALDAIARQDGFDDWVADFRASARAAGIDEETLRAAFDDVRYLPRVVELDRAQPEFTRTVWDYLDRTVTPQRIATGRDKLALVRAEADAAAARYGVPASILVAIWGMESNYGSNYGDIPTIDALATLGFEGRREDWARGQLLAALKILQNGDIDRAQMIGSWAGAMGQTQFLPSSFLAYAVDADGDGRRDIWGSMADVMASTANFLARAGWQADQPWGVEVRLPPGFDVGRPIGLRQSSALWAAEGVQGVDGAPLPQLADGTDPAARRRPRAGLPGRAQLPGDPALQQLDQLRARGRPAGAAPDRRPRRAGALATRSAGARAQPDGRAADGAERARLRQRQRPTA